MRKKIITLLIAIISVLLILALAWYILGKNKKNSNNVSFTPNTSNVSTTTATGTVENLLTSEEKAKLGLYHLAIYQKVGEINGKPNLKLLGVEEPKPIKFEVMSNEEKISRGLATSNKIQVLVRDEKGFATEYRIMKNDNDILELY